MIEAEVNSIQSDQRLIDRFFLVFDKKIWPKSYVSSNSIRLFYLHQTNDIFILTKKEMVTRTPLHNQKEIFNWRMDQTRKKHHLHSRIVEIQIFLSFDLTEKTVW